MNTDPVTLLAQAAAALRAEHAKCASLDSENQVLKARLAVYERNEKIASVAFEMRQLGLNAHLSDDELFQSLSLENDLDNVLRSVKLAGAGVPLPRVADLDTAAGTGKSYDTLVARMRELTPDADISSHY